jgi:sugar phosphate permease
VADADKACHSLIENDLVAHGSTHETSSQDPNWPNSIAWGIAVGANLLRDSLKDCVGDGLESASERINHRIRCAEPRLDGSETTLRQDARQDNMNEMHSIEGANAGRGAEKRWLYLLPAIFVTYSLAYVDRANFGFGVAAGLGATLHIGGKESSLLAGLFFLGYFAFQIPGTVLARRYSVSKVVFATLVAWGTFAALTGVIRQFWLLALDRFLLGVAESIIFPVMLHLLTRWFTRSERSRANTLLMLGNPVTVLWMSTITGYLIERLGWQRTFIVEGLPAILWAFAWSAIVRDRPSEVKWLSPEAGVALERRIAEEQIDIAPVGDLRRVLLRGDVLLLSAQYFCWSLGVYGFVLWLPTIVKQGAAVSITNTGLLSAIPYLAAILLMLLVGHIADKTQQRRSIVWPFLLIAGIALFGSFLFAQRSFPTAFVCLVIAGGCMYAPYGPFFAIIPELVPSEVTAEVMAMINSCGALGGFFGSYLVGLLQAITGNAQAGYLLMSLSLMLSAGLMLLLRETPRARGAIFTETWNQA